MGNSTVVWSQLSNNSASSMYMHVEPWTIVAKLALPLTAWLGGGGGGGGGNFPTLIRI